MWLVIPAGSTALGPSCIESRRPSCSVTTNTLLTWSCDSLQVGLCMCVSAGAAALCDFPCHPPHRRGPVRISQPVVQLHRRAEGVPGRLFWQTGDRVWDVDSARLAWKVSRICQSPAHLHSNNLPFYCHLSPKFLAAIFDKELRSWAAEMHKTWKSLSRKVIQVQLFD